MAKVLLSDIAQRCGTSVSTVSRVLSGDTSRKTSEDTRNKIVQCAQELGWFRERQMGVRRAKPLSLAILFLSDHEDLDSPFFNAVIRGLEAACQDMPGHSVSFKLLSHYDLDFFSDFESDHFDIAILLGRVRSDVLERIRRTSAKLVYAGLNPIGGMDEVICDARAGIMLAMRHLHDLGHRRIAYIGPCHQRGVENEFRYEGYLEGLSQLGLPFDSHLVADSYLSSQDGYKSAQELFSSDAHPTAAICANDNLAIGVMKYLSDAGLRVPEDVSLTGFDNIEASAYLTPPLTTVDVPKRDFGRFALSLAIDRIDSGRDYDVRLSLPFRLIVRQSTREVAHG